MESPRLARVLPIDNRDEDSSIELMAVHTSHTWRETNALLFPDSESGERKGLESPTSAKLTLFNAYALFVGSQIGSGIFSSTSQIDKNVASPGWAILVWILAGLVSWAGAASFGELGTAIARNGGMQEYLHYIFGDFLASVMSRTWVMAVKPASMAVQSIIVANYCVGMALGGERSWLAEKCVAMVTLGTIVLINLLGSNASARFTDTLLLSKLATILLIILIAMLVLTVGIDGDGKGVSQDWRVKDWFASPPDGNDASALWDVLGHYSTALFAGLFAYGGWDNVSSHVRKLHCKLIQPEDQPRRRRDEKHIPRSSSNYTLGYSDSDAVLHLDQPCILYHPTMEHCYEK